MVQYFSHTQCSSALSQAEQTMGPGIADLRRKLYLTEASDGKAHPGRVTNYFLRFSCAGPNLQSFC
jgi:hypothetical protein